MAKPSKTPEMSADDIPDPTSLDDSEAPAIAAYGGPCEYRAPDNTHWLCNETARLQADYRIPAAQLPVRLREWHGLFCTAPQTWKILRHTYGISAMLGSDFDDMRPRLEGEIAEENGVTIEALRQHLADTHRHWARQQLAGDLTKRMADSAKPLVSGAEAAAMLRRYGLDALTDPKERQVVITRISELGHLLEMEAGRPLAIQAIFQEIMLAKTMAKVLREAGKDGAVSSYAKLMSEYTAQQAAYEDTMKRLGATQEQNPGFLRKVAFNDCVSNIAAGIQAYEERGDTALIDGMSTEAEVVLLLTPVPLRPPMYRPDIVLQMQDWKKYLWDPNYLGEKLDGRVVRHLLPAFEAAVTAAITGAATADATDRDTEDAETDLMLAGSDTGGDAELPDSGGAPDMQPRPALHRAEADVAVI